jgi:hypothetical protein
MRGPRASAAAQHHDCSSSVVKGASDNTGAPAVRLAPSPAVAAMANTPSMLLEAEVTTTPSGPPTCVFWVVRALGAQRLVPLLPLAAWRGRPRQSARSRSVKNYDLALVLATQSAATPFLPGGSGSPDDKSCGGIHADSDLWVIQM